MVVITEVVVVLVTRGRKDNGSDGGVLVVVRRTQKAQCLSFAALKTFRPMQ